MFTVPNGKSRHGPLAKQSDTLWQHDTEFSEKPADLVGKRCA